MELLKNTISIYSTKGGVGKTLISYALHKSLQRPIYSNDKSLVTVIKSDTYRPNKMPVKSDTIYDFGGFKSPANVEILLSSELILIPVLNDSNSLIQTLETIKDLEKHCDDICMSKEDLFKRIVFIGNRISRNREKEKIQNSLSKKLSEYTLNFVFFSESKFLKNTLENFCTPEELYHTNRKTMLNFKKPFEEWQSFIHKIENKEWSNQNASLKMVAQG